MKLFYDKSDLPHAKKLRDNRFTWLQSLGATDLSLAPLDEEGFFFAYEHGDEGYRKLVDSRPFVLERPKRPAPRPHLPSVRADAEVVMEARRRPSPRQERQGTE